MFRFKKSVPVSYERQGYIYFKSRCYHDMTAREQHRLVNLCLSAGGQYYQPLFEFVTSDEGATAICLRHHLSRSTLERAVRKYYTDFPADM